ncbi:MAG TPA: PqqD family protein [Planctomycetota bacterium]|nr:PqqD family protein [Planctomycetota bacterium]HRR82104.1 PqqD family protein [Planctomycetota bacterium]HRT96700.1 PqqD family protein [Planctomycetota bacterium]
MLNWAFWRRQQPLSREQSLASVPVRNAAIEEERTDEGEVRLVIPLRAPRWAWPLSRLFYVPKTRRVVLDEIGAYVWSLCDGERSVREIIQALSRRYKLHRKEAEVSVVAYLRQLARRGLLGIAVRRTDAKPDAQER